MKLALNQESADLLRELAERMPVEINRIYEATEDVQGVYARVAGTVGEYEPQFKQLLKSLEEIQAQIKEPITWMPDQLNLVADVIESYIRKYPDAGSCLEDWK